MVCHWIHTADIVLGFLKWHLKLITTSKLSYLLVNETTFWTELNVLYPFSDWIRLAKWTAYKQLSIESLDVTQWFCFMIAHYYRTVYKVCVFEIRVRSKMLYDRWIPIEYNLLSMNVIGNMHYISVWINRWTRNILFKLSLQHCEW